MHLLGNILLVCVGVFIGEIKSVYVRNLPPTVSPSEIEEEFKNFGKLKETEGVVVRSRKVRVQGWFIWHPCPSCSINAYLT